MKKKLSAIWCGLLLSSTAAVQAQSADLQATPNPGIKESQIGHTAPKPAAKPATEPSSDTSGQSTTDEVLDALHGRNWQRNYDIEFGNVILLRRSTNEPAPDGKTVILRWRTPQEYKQGSFASSKQQTVKKPSGKFRLLKTIPCS